MQAFLGYTMFAFLFDWTDTNWLARRKGKMFRFTPSPVSCVPACGSFDRFALLTTFSRPCEQLGQHLLVGWQGWLCDAQVSL
jgi:hypothetical protein